MTTLKVDQYYTQVDSKTGHASRSCFASTVAMAIKYLKPSALMGSNADDDYLRTVLKYGDTTQSSAHIKACKEYGIIAKFNTKGTRLDLLSEINAGFPVAVGFLHKGHVSKPTGGGHWSLLIGYDNTHGVFHDPYGELDNVHGGYVSIGRGGKAVRYTWKNWLPRWEVEGPRTGWYMTFRLEEEAKPPAPTQFPNTWKGVMDAARVAGAKFPQVVAAQWALESGYGKHTSGKNNYFGLKGPGTKKTTQEFINGAMQTVTASFLDFDSLFDCVQYLVKKWYKPYKWFNGVNRANSPEECARLLVIEGYATDPQYSQKLVRIMRENG